MFLNDFFLIMFTMYDAMFVFSKMIPNGVTLKYE